MEGNEFFIGPGMENPLVLIGGQLCPEVENKGICSGHGTCNLGMCVVALRSYFKTIF